ncbi:MAG: PSD1 and planctomycete cytochrome C domain-containing protein [Pirellulaceae bacterium]|nr:PSD1 and planctomycete cytochrome C domain-containing protein [Pirellulaceae bacterium]
MTLLAEHYPIRPNRFRRLCIGILCLLAIDLSAHAAESKSTDNPKQAPGASSIRFNRDVLPILAENCFACHGFDAKSREADLRLDTRNGATAAKDGIAPIVPGRPESSVVMTRILSTDSDERMPPEDSGKKISASQREILRRWIAEGAEYEKHWSFVQPVRIDPPMLSDVVHPIDRFIQSKLAESQLIPADRADASTLIRRVSLDLIGLPPTLDELDSFLEASEKDPDAAYRELVERLLMSPHYGERWGRWWLDQARYADSNGYSIDAPRQIWKFRDWVIEAFNDDMPFDQFTIEQLAGDLLPTASESQQIATGFHRNTQINQEGGIDKEQFRIDSIFDRVATTGTVWLGLTVGCAQCHDHKFDPIEQKEYYQLFAFLNNQDEPTMKVYDPEINVREVTAEFKETEARLSKIFKDQAIEFDAWEEKLSPEFEKTLAADIKKILAVSSDKRTFAQNRKLFAVGFGSVESFRDANERYVELDEIINKGTTTLVMKELAQPRTTTVFIKGDFTRPADEVTPGTPGVLHSFSSASEKANRLDLARWITSRENPLTARVIVNRIWQYYFGRGIVETENDFGLLGSRPTHPELLDWLACEFVDRGWSMKAMHRLIVSSRTYQQSSKDRIELHEKDRHNYLLGRQRRLRLDGEIVRDVALAITGKLSLKIGGPPVFPPIPEGVMGQGQVKRTWTVSKGEDRYRRGIYTFIYRATPPPSLNVFDTPDGFSACTRRNRSNTPLQSLTMMNDASFFELAKVMKKAIEKDGLQNAFRRCTGRLPHQDELVVLEQLDTITAARALLNLDETITRE